MEENNIKILGARVHNLQNVDLEIPRGKLVVITGLSGSGKSSLAFDTIYAEGQRRYMETLSTYARQFVGTMERPDVDKITGLSPVVAIEQKTTNKNPRSTVGTVTEINDFLRLLYARASRAYSPVTGEEMVHYTDEQIVELILKEFDGRKIAVTAPIVKGRKGHYRELFESLIKKGYLYARIDGEIRENWDHGFHYIQHTNYNSVMAVPSDMYVQGYDGKGVAKLRLWQAKAPDFDMSSFSLGNYNTAMSKNANAELISKVLYPNDNHVEGKILRLRQQYFLSAASIGDIVQNHLSSYATLENLPDKVAIQLNDTHPTLAIPEMMRILLDECGFGWDKAFNICQKVFSYTNHTVMAEALEKWNVDIFKMTLPRIYQIVVEMDRRARAELEKVFPGDKGKIDYMALIGDNQVRMANICAYTANSINGVSKLHSEIIKESVFHDYYLFKPQAFKNVTNGIAYRRWLLASNPGLCKLLDETIGDGYKHDASDLSKLNKFENDKTVLKRLNEIKLENKTSFANYLAKSTSQVIDPNSIFDCQVKRMHEYKRQHLNALNIAAQYLYLKENPNADFIPKTYIFGAKAAPGYYMAKQMIRMICKLGDLINNDPAVRDKLRVVYLEEYCVSLSEHLMPAAEVSEQISLAGTEASGTGNMKFMLNGAITLGTLDGANVEIADAAGKENELIFGMLTPEVNNLKQVGYHPNAFITGDDVANYTLNFLERGWNGENFHEVTENLRTSDPYMVMADFKDYRRAQADLQKLYGDREKWAQMSLKNTANSGIFSADRAVLDYARDIWYASPVPMGK